MKETQQINGPVQFDSFLPQEMARRAEQTGVKKATMPIGTTFVLAVLAGAFICSGHDLI